MHERRSKIFARVIIRPKHFDAKGLTSKCFNPRPNDKDGISVFDCDELELHDLMNWGEKIAGNARKNTPESEFYGLLFFLEQSASEKFNFIKKLKKDGTIHHSIKHIKVNYKDKFPENNPEITRDHNDLFKESLSKTRAEIETLLTNPNKWNMIYKELIDLIDKNKNEE